MVEGAWGDLSMPTDHTVSEGSNYSNNGPKKVCVQKKKKQSDVGVVY